MLSSEQEVNCRNQTKIVSGLNLAQEKSSKTVLILSLCSTQSFAAVMDGNSMQLLQSSYSEALASFLLTGPVVTSCSTWVTDGVVVGTRGNWYV